MRPTTPPECLVLPESLHTLRYWPIDLAWSRAKEVLP